MLALGDIGLALFWAGLTLVFLNMARASKKVKDELSITFQRANKAADFQGPDINHLEPVFKHMLSVDTTGFVLSAAAAGIELAVVTYHLLQ